jgi:hypothetical protein
LLPHIYNKIDMQSKRFRLVVIMMALNFITFWLGIWQSVDLTALGTGLAMINAPVYGYILGETIRPSGQKKKDQEPTGEPVV